MGSPAYYRGVAALLRAKAYCIEAKAKGEADYLRKRAKAEERRAASLEAQATTEKVA